MTSALRGGGKHREYRLGPVQCLDLSLLVDAEHQSPLGRVHVQADDVTDLLREHWILRQFPRVLFVRGQTERAPHSRDRRLRNIEMLRHRSCGPVCGILRCRFEGRGNQILDLVVVDRPRTARAWFVEQPVASVLDEPVPPPPHRASVQPQPLRHFGIRSTIGSSENDSRPYRQTCSGLASPRPPLEFYAFGLGQHNLRRSRTTSCHDQP